MGFDSRALSRQKYKALSKACFTMVMVNIFATRKTILHAFCSARNLSASVEMVSSYDNCFPLVAEMISFTDLILSSVFCSIVTVVFPMLYYLVLFYINLYYFIFKEKLIRLGSIQPSLFLNHALLSGILLGVAVQAC